MAKIENKEAQQILFEDLKVLAIKKTLEYFKDEHKIKCDALTLNSHLDLEKQIVKSQLKTNSTYLDIGEYDKLKNKLFHYFSEMRRAISDFETDNLGLMSNGLSNSKEDTIKDYCSVTFYSLFHSSELKKIKRIELTESGNKQPQQPKKRDNQELSNYELLEDLFKNPETYKACVNVLREVEPPIINIKQKYIGKEKGSLVLWVDILKHHDLIVRFPNNTIYSKLISEAFDFSISDELFRKVSIRATEKYETEFNSLLSQVYQGVKKVK